VPPPGFLGFVTNPLRLTAEFILRGNNDCRELGGTGFAAGSSLLGGEDCVAHVDQTQNSVRLAADTDFSNGLGVGMQFQWVKRASAVGTRQTSNQYNFDVFGRFVLRSSTSDIPPPAGTR
jgi:hypothetical protein